MAPRPCERRYSPDTTTSGNKHGAVSLMVCKIVLGELYHYINFGVVEVKVFVSFAVSASKSLEYVVILMYALLVHAV